MMPLIVVIYDSINHSIFEGQVLTPLIKRLNLNLCTTVHLISFEHEINDATQLLKKRFESIDSRITITLFKRNRFIHTSLFFKDIKTVKTFVKSFPTYQLMARGPLAGYITKKAATKNCTSVTIQARGLLAEEYAYTHQNKEGKLSLLHRMRLHQLYAVERQAYQPFKKSIPFFIETVSPALQEYLETTYNAPSKAFIESLFDIPDAISDDLKKHCRTQRRTELGITPETTVYVYNGSLKPWQCTQETINHFLTIQKTNPTAFFVALTPDTVEMTQLLQKNAVSYDSYRVLCALDHTTVMEYLCAADYGFLLRVKHPMNWVSRPTKLLEYQAAGITIIHNNTIALLSLVMTEKVLS